MKAGQQLVFGEQLGWLDPGLLKQTDSAEFFRQLVRLRAKNNRYFFAGEMVRPPKLLGEVPQVTADWQWSGEWPVTTDAVMTGAWVLPAQRRVLLLFVNVSDRPVTAAVQTDRSSWGLPAKPVACEITSSTSDATLKTTPDFGVPLTFAPRQAQAWELKW